MKRATIAILAALALGALAGCERPAEKRAAGETNDSSTVGPRDRDSAATGASPAQKNPQPEKR